VIRTRTFALSFAAVALCAMNVGLVAQPAVAAAKKSSTLIVLVTNDDGVGAPGIDTLVQALRTVKKTKVVVVAPAANQSGTGEKTTRGTLTTSRAMTASGFTATAVEGYPADAVTAALDQLGVKPNVVMSGINKGQNLGAFTGLSGTIGAAKMAVQRGIPAFAVSQGEATEPQYDAAAKVARVWLVAHRAELLNQLTARPTAVTNVNVPNCPTGEPRGVVDVVTATNSDGAFNPTQECASAVTKPITDIEAFNNGWAAFADVVAGPRPAT
jgi:5'-nucleotidase